MLVSSTWPSVGGANKYRCDRPVSVRETGQSPASVEHSDCSHAYTDNGLDLTVCIYRSTGQANWRLAIIDRDSEPVECQATFTTEQDALEEFRSTVRNGTVPGLSAGSRADG